MDTYRAAAAAMVRSERYGEAVTVLLRHAGACDRTQSYASLSRCYLSAVVTYLYMGDVVGAEAGYYDFMEARGSLPAARKAVAQQNARFAMCFSSPDVRLFVCAGAAV